MPVAAALCAACSGAGDAVPLAKPPDEARVAARWAAGTLDEAELEAELARLPAALRERFETPSGRRELARSLVDKRLLAQEAARLELDRLPEIRRQVDDLEQRLVIQELLARRERERGAPTEAELRAAWEADRSAFAEPERLRIGRLLVLGARDRAQAATRAKQLAARLRAGEGLAALAPLSDGAERERGGEVGLFTAEEAKRAGLGAAIELEAGGVAGPIERPEGFLVLQLIERRAARVPGFEEVRAEVAARLAPRRQRELLDALLVELRARADVSVTDVGGRRAEVR